MRKQVKDVERGELIKFSDRGALWRCVYKSPYNVVELKSTKGGARIIFPNHYDWEREVEVVNEKRKEVK